MLVVRRACFALKEMERDAWLRNNIFQSTSTIDGKVCRFVIDSGSCENVISEEDVQKLGLKTEQHPSPYKLAWLKKGNDVKVSKCCLVSFSVCPKYKDQAWCDVVTMDACHLLLGRPWLYDRRVTHDGRANTYSLLFNTTKIVLLLTKESIPKPQAGEGTTLLTRAQFEKELTTTQTVYILIRKDERKIIKVVSECIQPLLEAFRDVFPTNSPDGLPPLRDIQHQIDLVWVPTYQTDLTTG